MIERDSAIPYYCQLMEIIRLQIAGGMLKEGQRTPSEFELRTTPRGRASIPRSKATANIWRRRTTVPSPK